MNPVPRTDDDTDDDKDVGEVEKEEAGDDANPNDVVLDRASSPAAPKGKGNKPEGGQ